MSTLLEAQQHVRANRDPNKHARNIQNYNLIFGQACDSMMTLTETFHRCLEQCLVAVLAGSSLFAKVPVKGFPVLNGLIEAALLADGQKWITDCIVCNPLCVNKVCFLLKRCLKLTIEQSKAT